MASAKYRAPWDFAKSDRVLAASRWTRTLRRYGHRIQCQGKHLSGAIVKNGGSTANADQNDVVANAKHVVRR
jgi:hypothetical protein